MTEDLLTADTDLLDDDDLFVKPQEKKKILFISDHPLAPSGVGVQARFLIDGLVATGKYKFLCLGGAIKHQDYRTIKVNDDFIVKPVDGFGTHDMIRNLLVTEKPDAIFIFTDPRQFIWLWEIEDEIHQVCPIAYWHVWDNDPFPAYNRAWYESTDLISCLSHKTYELVQPEYPEKTTYIPHSFPEQVYYQLPEEQRKQLLNENFGQRADWFKALWVNRNASRKLPADIMASWKQFLDNLEQKHGHRNALMIMHSDPGDQEGPNLYSVAETLGINDNVWFSTEKLEFEKMNILHNIVDCTVNTAKNEGFGLSTLISMQVGKPIVALKTGGETRKVVDYRDGTEHGVALDPVKRVLVGSQLVPYIYEDFAGHDDTANAFMKLYEMPEEERTKLGEKCKAYVRHEFSYEDMIENWDKKLTECIDQFKEQPPKRWEVMPINPNTNNNTSVERKSPEEAAREAEAHNAQEASNLQSFIDETLEGGKRTKKAPKGGKKVATKTNGSKLEKNPKKAKKKPKVSKKPKNKKPKKRKRK